MLNTPPRFQENSRKLIDDHDESFVNTSARISELMCASSPSDGGDAVGIIVEFVPGLAAKGDGIVVAFEDVVREPIVPDELPSILNSVSSVDRGGRVSRVVLSCTFSCGYVCHSAWSRIMIACASDATSAMICFSCSAMVWVSAQDISKPAPLIATGQIAPKM